MHLPIRSLVCLVSAGRGKEYMNLRIIPLR